MSIHITGVVQGVGYRYFVVRKARERNVTGWVKNRPDGSVDIEAVGERPQLEEFLRLVRIGPPAAHTAGMEARWYDNGPVYDDFDVRF